MYFAEQSLLADRKAVARNNLWFAVRADPTMILKPTFWALLIATVGPTKVYQRYIALRKGEA